MSPATARFAEKTEGAGVPETANFVTERHRRPGSGCAISAIWAGESSSTRGDVTRVTRKVVFAGQGLSSRRAVFRTGGRLSPGSEAAAAGFPSLQVTIQGLAPHAGTVVFLYVL
jgi:hypothetical protein